MAVPYAFVMICCFMILTGNKPVIDLSDNMVVEAGIFGFFKNAVLRGLV
jgi:hypothetical protein